MQITGYDFTQKVGKNETKLGNATLRKYSALNPDPDLEKVLRWSEAVNEDISLLLRNIPPFPHAIKAIKEYQKMPIWLLFHKPRLRLLYVNGKK